MIEEQKRTLAWLTSRLMNVHYDAKSAHAFMTGYPPELPDYSTVPAMTGTEVEYYRNEIASLESELARYKTALAMIAGKVEFVQLADGRCEVRCEIEPDLYEVLGLVE